MTYTATAALPDVDAARAVSGLRGQLRMLALKEGSLPDWATLRMAGPDEVVGRHGVVWHEWTAAVDACGPIGGSGPGLGTANEGEGSC